MIDKCKYCGCQIPNKSYLTKNGKQCKGCDLDYRYEVEKKSKLNLRPLIIKSQDENIRINLNDILNYEFSSEIATIEIKIATLVFKRKDFLYVDWENFRIQLLTFFEEQK